MKTTLLLISLVLLSFYNPKIRYCIVRTVNSENERVDTCYFKKVYCGLCIATFVGDTIPKLVDGRGYIFKDSVGDFEVLRISEKRIKRK